MKSRPMSKGMTESEKDASSDVKPKSPLPWTSCLGDIVGADKVPVVIEISAKNADYITHACNAHPKLVEMLKALSDGATVYGQWSLLSRKARELLKELGETSSGLGISSELPPE